MRLSYRQFTVRRMMIVVLLFSLVFFTYERLRRTYSPALDGNSGRFLVFVKTFRGPRARDEATKLAALLRYDHGLPAYTLAEGDFNRGKKGFRGSDGSVGVFVGHLESLKSAQTTSAKVRKSKAIAAIAGSLRPMPTQNPYLP
jgi:hypothetical protein